jgi:hypothetical protein
MDPHNLGTLKRHAHPTIPFAAEAAHARARVRERARTHATLTSLVSTLTAEVTHDTTCIKLYHNAPDEPSAYAKYIYATTHEPGPAGKAARGRGGEGARPSRGGADDARGPKRRDAKRQTAGPGPQSEAKAALKAKANFYK